MQKLTGQESSPALRQAFAFGWDSFEVVEQGEYDVTHPDYPEMVATIYDADASMYIVAYDDDAPVFEYEHEVHLSPANAEAAVLEFGILFFND